MKLHQLFIVVLFATNFIQSMRLSELGAGCGRMSIDPNDPAWIRKEYTLATTLPREMPDASIVQVDVTFEECPALESSKRNYAQAEGTPEAIVSAFIRMNKGSGILSVYSVRATNYQSLSVQYDSFLGIIKSLHMLRLYPGYLPAEASIFSVQLKKDLEHMKDVATCNFSEQDKEKALLIMLGKINGRISKNESDRSWKVE